MRLHLKTQPFNLLLILTLVTALLSFFFFSQTIDIHLHDTYFIFAGSHLLWLMALINFVFWLLYKFCVRLPFLPGLTWLHLLSISIATLLFMWVLISEKLVPGPRQYYDFSMWKSWKEYGWNKIMTSISFLLFLVGPLLFLANLFIALFRYKR